MPESSTLKIVSGGQTGVDRAALDVAAECGLPRGGWCPKGRKAEDGPLSAVYPLRETPSSGYSERTRWNVRDSDGTLVLAAGALTGGTALTVRAARRAGKPVLVVDPLEPGGVSAALQWMEHAGVGTLNVAGPRESGAPGTYERASLFLRDLLSRALDEGLR